MEGKRCSTCGLVQSSREFNRRRAAPDGLQPRCRTCSRAWYLEHREVHIANVARRNAAHRALLAEKLAEYFASNPCVDCGETDVRCLQFDHRDRGNMVADISRLVTTHSSWQRVLREIEKCDVRCANCHCRRTAQQVNSWRHRWFMAHGSRTAT